MTKLEEQIHDVVNEAVDPMNANQILRELQDRGIHVGIEQVKEAIKGLVDAGFLQDAELTSYFALC